LRRLYAAWAVYPTRSRSLRRGLKLARLQFCAASVAEKIFEAIMNAGAVQYRYLSVLVAILARIMGFLDWLYVSLQRIYEYARWEPLQLVAGLACLQCIKVSKATFKCFVFVAERRLAFLDRRSGLIGRSDLSLQSECGLPKLDSVSDLYKLLNRLTRRIERRQDSI
jgi:hypothetical protein